MAAVRQKEMTRRWLFFLTFLTVFVLTGSVNASDIKDQLDEISQATDKSSALARLELLLNNKELSRAEELAILKQIALKHYQLGDFQRAIKVGEKVIEFARLLESVDEERDAQKMLGISYYYKGERKRALEAYFSSLAFYDPDTPSQKKAHLFNNIALVYAASSEIGKALDYYQRAETIYQTYGDKTDQVDVRYNIAGIYLRLERFDIAINMFHEVIKQRELLKDNFGIAKAQSDLGVAYKHAGELQKALMYLKSGLSYFEEVSDAYQKTENYHNIAEVYNELRQTDQAIIYAKKAMVVSEKYEYFSVYAGSLYSMAMALFFQDRLDEALIYLQRSSSLSKKIDYKQQYIDNLALFSLLYARLHKIDKALSYHDQFTDSNNILQNQTLNEQLAQFEAQQLQQKIANMHQQETMKSLALEKAKQRQNFIIVIVILCIVVSFVLFKRRYDLRAKNRLAVQVKQRTEALERSTRELKQANTVKSQFLANMSHEIRTPLTAVMGQAEAIIHQDVSRENIISEVEVIYSNSIHLLELINNILDLSKVEANKLELDIGCYDLQELIAQIRSIFAEQANNKGLDFTIHCHLPTPFLIDVDALRLKQILINLCANAVKFTEQGSININFSASGSGLLVSIVDTGIGMSDSQVEQVFNSFTQADSSIGRRFGGTGLGLGLSEQLAKLMGGSISVSSQLNVGSMFTLKVPLQQSAEGAEIRSLCDVADNDYLYDRQTLSGKVLLADDHDDNRRLIARMLESLGLEVITAINGQEAVELVMKHTPDLVLLDIQMPHVNGIEAFNMLRQKGYRQPIIALTANAMAHEVEQYIKQGFSDHLKKPIERHVFIRKIAKCLNQHISDKRLDSMPKAPDTSDLDEKFREHLVLEQQDIILHLKNNDIEKLVFIIHKIAGAAQMFGYAKLSLLAIDIEQDIKKNHTVELRKNVQSLLNEIDNVLW